MENDIGRLTNQRMGLEIAVGLAFLTGRRLSLTFNEPVPGAPLPSIAESDTGRAATLLDLFELPVPIVHDEEWNDLSGHQADRHDWGPFTDAFCVCDDGVDLAHPQLVDFANGRRHLRRPPESSAQIVDIAGRPLAHWSYFFYAEPAKKRLLHAVLRGVRPRQAYIELGAKIAEELGSYNAVHLRRSDITIGIPRYGEVTPDEIASNVAEIIPDDLVLLVCSEVDGADELFDPLRRRFSKIVFANDLILNDHREQFFQLPRHEENALGVITQEVASRAQRFVGTIGSTFTAMIQRQRLFRDPRERFLFTADFTPDGPLFERGEFLEVADGSYSWNRIGYAMMPEVLSWFREWPEAL